MLFIEKKGAKLKPTVQAFNRFAIFDNCSDRLYKIFRGVIAKVMNDFAYLFQATFPAIDEFFTGLAELLDSHYTIPLLLLIRRARHLTS